MKEQIYEVELRPDPNSGDYIRISGRLRHLVQVIIATKWEVMDCEEVRGL